MTAIPMIDGYGVMMAIVVILVVGAFVHLRGLIIKTMAAMDVMKKEAYHPEMMQHCDMTSLAVDASSIIVDYDAQDDLSGMVILEWISSLASAS